MTDSVGWSKQNEWSKHRKQSITLYHNESLNCSCVELNTDAFVHEFNEPYTWLYSAAAEHHHRILADIYFSSRAEDRRLSWLRCRQDHQPSVQYRPGPTLSRVPSTVRRTWSYNYSFMETNVLPLSHAVDVRDNGHVFFKFQDYRLI